MILYENIYHDIYVPNITTKFEALVFLYICNKFMDYEMLDLIFNKIKYFKTNQR